MIDVIALDDKNHLSAGRTNDLDVINAMETKI